MKRLVNRHLLVRSLAVLLLLLVIPSFFVSHRAFSEQSIVTIGYPVSYPLPTVPEPVLAGGTLKVEVDAGPDAGGWAAKLTSGYDSSFLSMRNSTYTDGNGWTIFYDVPVALRPELYSLNLAFIEDGAATNHTQPRSVWVLDEWPERLTIGHITDMHLPYGGDVFATYVHESNLIRPDVVICTGDVVDVETIAKAWVYLQNVLGRLEVPSFILPGNHDYAGAASEYYQRYCGLLNYSANVGDFLFLALDSTDEGFVSLSQLRWAERVLQRHPKKVKIVGFHHPLFGNGDGGEITGDWSEIEDLREYMYFSWEEHMTEARELLRLIEEYDVRLILAGHIHTDVIYVYNERHNFVTTGPCGGSLREGDYPGSRLIEVDAEGNVVLDEYAEGNLFDPPNSIPIGNVSYCYKAENDGTETAVSATVVNGLEVPLTDAVLEFHVSAEHAVEDYEFHLATPSRVETFTTEREHRFIAHVDVPAQSTLHLTLAAADDNVEPTIEVLIPEEIEEETPIPITVVAADEGWGVKGVEVSYSTNGGATWIDVDLPFSAQVSADEYIIEYSTTEYEVVLPGQEGGTGLSVEVRAFDFSDNSKTRLDLIMIGPLYSLSVESSPMIGVTFTLDGESQTTPFTVSLEEGVYTISASMDLTVAGTEYSFTGWEDGNTDLTRTIDLKSDTTLTVLYGAAPAEFTISGLKIDPTSVETGETLTISAECTNTGGQSGEYTVTLKIDGDVRDEKKITLSPGEEETVSFSISAAEQGTFAVDVNDLTGSYTATEPKGGGIPGFPYESIVVGLVVGVIILWLLRQRN